MALIDKASLLMVPSTYEAGTLYNVLPSGNRAPDSTDQNSGYDQTRADFTFDRGSNAAATRVNSDGLIEKYRENTLEHSNDFDQWDIVSGVTLTSGQGGYDGSSGAWLVEATSSTFAYFYRIPTTNSGIRTRSVYAKQGTSSNLTFLWNSYNQNKFASFDLSNGTFTNANCLADIEDVGNGWYRCITTITDASNVYAFLISVSDETGGGNTAGDNIYVQNAQQESGLVPTDYLDSGATTGKAGVLIDLPHINYDANGENGSLLLEPSRTNLVTQSEYFEGWIIQSGTTLTTNTTETLSPEGLYNATKAVGNGNFGVLLSELSTAGGDNVKSVYLKGVSGGESVVLKDPNQTNQTKTCALTTEWQRFDLLDNQPSSFGFWIDDIPASGIYMWGAQLEQASYPTSYIPNHSGGSVTRLADSCYKTGIASLIGQTEGTIYFEGSSDTIGGSTNLINFNFSTNSVVINKQSTGIIRALVNTASPIILDSSPVSGIFKAAIGYKNGDSVLYVNGTLADSSTNSFTFATALTEVNLGTGVTYFAAANQSKCNQALLFKTRLSNAKLAELTTL